MVKKTKAQLEAELFDLQNKYTQLVNTIEDITEDVIDELDPCDEGISYIEKLRKEAGLKSLTTRVSLPIEIEIPLEVYNKLINAEIDPENISLVFTETDEQYVLRDYKNDDIEEIY